MFNLWLNVSLLQYVPYAVINHRLSSSFKQLKISLLSTRYLKECALIHISMSIIEEVFSH